MKDKVIRILKEWILPFGIEILVILLIYQFIAFPVVVPTGSMIPTIEEHSVLISTRVYSIEENAKRGAILAFNSDELGKVLIKRLIGLPGEKVEVKDDGSVWINGERLDEPYVVNISADTGEFEVPEGCFLFFGDNRNASYDARYWMNPYIPCDEVIGQARFTLFPFQNFGVLK